MWMLKDEGTTYTLAQSPITETAVAEYLSISCRLSTTSSSSQQKATQTVVGHLPPPPPYYSFATGKTSLLPFITFKHPHPPSPEGDTGIPFLFACFRKQLQLHRWPMVLQMCLCIPLTRATSVSLKQITTQSVARLRTHPNVEISHFTSWATMTAFMARVKLHIHLSGSPLHICNGDQSNELKCHRSLD
jgi:hypothetical protein